MQKVLSHLKQNIIPSFTPKQRYYFLGLSILFSFLFMLFTLIVIKDHFRSIDFDATVKIQDNLPLRFDDFFSILSITGRFEFSLVILLIAVFLYKKYLGLIAIWFFAFGHIIEIIGKFYLDQKGPPHMFLRTTHLSKDFPGFYVDANFTYPSGHSMRVTFLCVIITMLIYKSKKLPAYLKYFLISLVLIYTGLMLFSRVSLGEHWLSDVIGGGLLGTAFGLLSLLLL